MASVWATALAVVTLPVALSMVLLKCCVSKRNAGSGVRGVNEVDVTFLLSAVPSNHFVLEYFYRHVHVDLTGTRPVLVPCLSEKSYSFSNYPATSSSGFFSSYLRSDRVVSCPFSLQRLVIEAMSWMASFSANPTGLPNTFSRTLMSLKHHE